MKIKELILEHKKAVILSAVCIFLASVVIGIWRDGIEKKKTYQLVNVTKGDIRSIILSTGTVEPENRLEIKPPIPGRADEILVDEGDVVKKGQMLVRMSSTERAALLDAALARGEEEYKKWDAYYKSAPILAPINGTIIARNVEPGQTVTSSDAVLTMSDRLTVKAQVDETDIADIKLKQNADVILDAYPNERLPSTVDKIAYDSKTVNNVTTYIVDVLPKETPDFMRSGMTANVEFLIEERNDVLTLPTNAIRTKEGKQFVLCPPDNKIGDPVEVDVVTGLSDGKNIEIVEGLKEGDEVLVNRIKTSGGSKGSTSPLTPTPPSRKR